MHLVLIDFFLQISSPSVNYEQNYNDTYPVIRKTTCDRQEELYNEYSEIDNYKNELLISTEDK